LDDTNTLADDRHVAARDVRVHAAKRCKLQRINKMLTFSL
jgi:hypothetical protein